jgi:hypothetical protein
MPTAALDRRCLLTTLWGGLITARCAFAKVPPKSIDQRLTQAQQEDRVSGLHALLVSRGGKPRFEYYGRGEDESWGRPLGTVVFAPEVPHDLRSVSKSVVGLVLRRTGFN